MLDRALQKTSPKRSGSVSRTVEGAVKHFEQDQQSALDISINHFKLYVETKALDQSARTHLGERGEVLLTRMPSGDTVVELRLDAKKKEKKAYSTHLHTNVSISLFLCHWRK